MPIRNRRILGTILALHGLLRIVFMETHLAFIREQLEAYISFGYGLSFIAILLLFLEFFIGTLLLFNIFPKIALGVGFLISLMMVVSFIGAAQYQMNLYYYIPITILLALQLAIEFQLRKYQTTSNIGTSN